jgi:hypothetical protein
MRRIACLVIAGVLAVGVAGCGDGGSSTPARSGTLPPEPETTTTTGGTTTTEALALPWTSW